MNNNELQQIKRHYTFTNNTKYVTWKCKELGTFYASSVVIQQTFSLLCNLLGLPLIPALSLLFGHAGPYNHLTSVESTILRVAVLV